MYPAPCLSPFSTLEGENGAGGWAGYSLDGCQKVMPGSLCICPCPCKKERREGKQKETKRKKERRKKEEERRY